MTGIPLIIVFLLAIVLMIVAISKWKVHPFLTIMAIALVFALIAGIPLVDIKDADGNVVTQGIPNLLGAGFSGTFTSIGIVIILGALVGSYLEATGGALKLADMVIKLVGEKRPEIAMTLMGWIISIPVFCDSGFVILNPIRKSIAQRTASSSVMLALALSGGLYIAHVFIPPTPGPIAAASTMGIGDDLLLVMGIGALVSIFPIIATIIVSRFLGKREQSAEDLETDEIRETYEELVASYGKLPNGFLTLAPIVVPIILMALGSIASATGMVGAFSEILRFFGTPIIALAVGVIFGIVLLKNGDRMDRFYDLTNETLKTVGPILFITAAGGVLGKVIAASDIVPFIKANAESLKVFGIFFPFLLAAILKTAQGSSTVAITTTAGIVAPLMPILGMVDPITTALGVMAIGAGAMTVSHANDSYFWVVTSFSGMEATQGYRTQTVLTLCLGLASIIEIFILWQIFA